MDWFDRLVRNRYIEVVLLANNQGRLLRSSRPVSSDDELLPSMLNTLEVLAQTLTAEFGCGEARLVQISTDGGHLLLYPVASSAYYVVVLVERTAPLTLISVELERTLRNLRLEDLITFDEMVNEEEETDLDANELIEAVRDWLRRRPPSSR